jgi:hypothetical protein
MGEMIREGVNTEKFILRDASLILLSRLLETGNLASTQVKELIPQTWKIFTALRQKGKNEDSANYYSRTSAALLLLYELDIDAEEDAWNNNEKSVLMKSMILDTIINLIREGKTTDIKKKTANALRILAERDFAIREVKYI